MYGLVNQAIEDLATSLGGQDLWKRICDRAGVDIAAFVEWEPYDDDITYRLVAAASAETGLSTDAVLDAFGRHWILFTARNGYEDLLRSLGSTLAEFLDNVDGMHASVSLTMPELVPPSFTCLEQADGTLRVEYRSRRAGLAPMAGGLLTGLGELLGTPVSVTLDRSRADGAEWDEFVVTFVPQARMETPAVETSR